MMSTSPSKPLAKKQQSGVALITALLITALVTVAAVSMASRQQLDIRRTGNMIEADQAWQYALGAEAWARQVLAADDPARDTLNFLTDPWAAVVPPQIVDGGFLQGKVEDLQGRFNLNNLLKDDGNADAAQVRILQNLLDAAAAKDLKLGLPSFAADIVVDWLDPQSVIYRSGAEDGVYLGLTPPYRAANQPMASPSELMALMGFSPRAVATLADSITALPRTPLNVNTASAPLLAALDAKISLQNAEQVVAYRRKKPFDNVTDFTSYMKSKFNVTVPPALLDVKSQYFLVDAFATTGRTHVQLYSLLERRGNTVKTIQRSIGVY